MTDTHSRKAGYKGSQPSLAARLVRFEEPSTARAMVQLADTLIPYFALIGLMVFSTRNGWPVWSTLLLSLPAGAFLVRIFIFFHDCCHGSFLASRKAMNALGFFLGVLAFTPFGEWRHSHGIHHTTSGNLDRRGTGDVWTMTLAEYQDSPWQRRMKYRLFRNPLVMFGLGPLFTFVIGQRFPSGKAGRRQVRSVVATDIALLAIALAASLAIGVKAYLLIQLPVMFFAGLGGIWLFYVQHQFDPGYWARTNDWNPEDAAMQGSSFYKLPKLLQWFSGNIGLHHIHHLRPRIPNYNLQACLDHFPELQLPSPLTIRKSIDSVHLNLWDEARHRLLSFREAGAMQKS
jgi:acyl-lipid omega-6 desaturase (Delta-12 desaturase)